MIAIAGRRKVEDRMKRSSGDLPPSFTMPSAPAARFGVEVKPVARFTHAAAAPRRAVQKVDPRFNRICSARIDEPDGPQAVRGWKPELPRPTP
jgi:hypothetical protein